jgi:hypothetical protein
MLQALQGEVKMLLSRRTELVVPLAALALCTAVPSYAQNGITAEADAEIGAELRAAPFPVPEGLQRRALKSERPDIALPSAEAEEGAGAADADRDGDGLTDAEEAQLGTDSVNPDTDGDALLDGWEVHEVNGVDLRAMGASPLHKDIFVEMDFMVHQSGGTSVDFGPTDAEKARIVQSFAAANVPNPDNIPGIAIHLEDGDEVPHDADLSPVVVEFFAIKAQHFDLNRAASFHYMIWADGYDGGTSSGRSMGIPAADFVVTLGRWPTAGGTPDEKVGTFIHELGHNLGLTHGGSDHIGFKPNHLSVMNYSFQTRGIRFSGARRFDYQRLALPSLAETRLDENNGLGRSPSLLGYSTVYNSPADVFTEAPAHAAIDWDVDGTVETPPVAVDLNNDNLRDVLAATPNEWGQIIYNGGSIGSPLSLAGALTAAEANAEPFPVEELTAEMLQEIEAEIAR